MSSDYTIEFLPSAAGQLNKLPKAGRRRLAAVIDGLGKNPWPPGCRSLAGYPGLYRIRLGAFRIVYRVEDDRLIVLLVRVARRSVVYRNLPPSSL